MEIYNTPNTGTVSAYRTQEFNFFYSFSPSKLEKIFFTVSLLLLSYWSVTTNSIFSACVSHQYSSREGFLLITPVMETHVRCFSKHVEFCLWMPIPEEFVLLKEDFFFLRYRMLLTLPKHTRTWTLGRCGLEDWEGMIWLPQLFFTFLFQMEILKWSHSLMSTEQRPKEK